MFVWMIIPLIIMILLLVYMFYSFRQLLALFVESKIIKNIVSFFLTIIFILPAFNMWGTFRIWSLIVLHIFAIRFITQIFNLFLNKYKIWKYVYRLMIIPVVCTLLLFVYGFYNIKNVIRTEYTVTADKNIKQSYKVALESDIHFGNASDNESIQKVTDRISNENADIVILCGDIVDESTTKEQMQNVFEILGRTKSRYGIYYVYGNHDKSPYIQAPNYTEKELIYAIENSGIKIIEDDSININDDLVLIGRKDRSEPRMTVDELMMNIDRDKYIIIMDHQPNEFENKADNGVDLQVSGHTHGGQIFPLSIINNLSKIVELNYGIETIKNMEAVVTSGVSGWGYPIRTDGHSEYVIINIKK